MLSPRWLIRGVAGRHGSAPMLSSVTSSRVAPDSSPNWASAPPSSSVRNLSSFGGNSIAGPSYQVYGEETAFAIRAIPPEFRVLPKTGTVILDAGKRGRLLLEFTPRSSGNNQGNNSKFQWDKPIRFALTAEEAASLVASLDGAARDGGSSASEGTVVEIVRSARPPSTGGSGFYNDTTVMAGSATPDKVFRARLLPPKGGSTVQLMVDYEWEGRGGQEPPTPNESRGPLEIKLMLGEYHVVRSIIQYSIPRLIGWSTMMDHAMEQALYKGNGGGVAPSGRNGNRRGEGFGGFESDGTVPF